MRNNTFNTGGRPIDSLALPRRAINALLHGGIRTVEEISDWSDDRLLSLPQFGPTFLLKVRNLAPPQHGKTES